MAPGATSSTPLSSAVYTDTVTVSGDGTYTTATGNNPGGYVPTAAGTYQWVAVYSGDSNNSCVTSPFGSEPETVTGGNATDHRGQDGGPGLDHRGPNGRLHRHHHQQRHGDGHRRHPERPAAGRQSATSTG